MEQRSVRLYRDERLPAGHARLPGSAPGEAVFLRFGSVGVQAALAEPAPAGEVHLAPDLWQRLTVPYDSIGLNLRQTGPGQVELGPAVAVLYTGNGSLSMREAGERASLYYGHLKGEPGLLALGFDGAIDWEGGRMLGYVLDNRGDGEGELIRTWFPIPGAVRLAWAIRREVIDRLRELTGNRTFNWVRSIGKWRFHTLLSADEALRRHLPETRLLRGAPDLASMLIRHEVVFVKHVHGIKGRNAVRVQQRADGFDLCFIQDGKQVGRFFSSLDELMPALRAIVGKGRCVVQQGIETVGQEGRALHIRIVPVRKPEGGWRPVVKAGCVAQTGSVFTNVANGAQEEDLSQSVERHYGLRPNEAVRLEEQMVQLCLAAAALLESAYHPLGILGFDLVVDQRSHQVWLLEANAVPGFAYPAAIETELTRSQIDLALALTGFEGKKRLPR